jgi:hypothetical protein
MTEYLGADGGHVHVDSKTAAKAKRIVQAEQKHEGLSREEYERRLREEEKRLRDDEDKEKRQDDDKKRVGAREAAHRKAVDVLRAASQAVALSLDGVKPVGALARRLGHHTTAPEVLLLDAAHATLDRLSAAERDRAVWMTDARRAAAISLLYAYDDAMKTRFGGGWVDMMPGDGRAAMMPGDGWADMKHGDAGR